MVGSTHNNNHEAPKLGKYDYQKNLPEKNAMGKKHFAKSRAKTIELGSGEGKEWLETENLDFEADEYNLHSHRLANVNDGISRIDKTEEITVPEFKNRGSALFKPQKLTETGTIKKKTINFSKTSGGKSPNETGSTEAQPPTDDFNDETLALDNYEVIGGDFDEFQNPNEQESILGDLN